MQWSRRLLSARLDMYWYLYVSTSLDWYVYWSHRLLYFTGLVDDLGRDVLVSGQWHTRRQFGLSPSRLQTSLVFGGQLQTTWSRLWGELVLGDKRRHGTYCPART